MPYVVLTINNLGLPVHAKRTLGQYTSFPMFSWRKQNRSVLFGEKKRHKGVWIRAVRKPQALGSRQALGTSEFLIFLKKVSPLPKA